MTLTGDTSATSAAAPIRTCVGCRVSDAQARLLRFRRRSDGHVVPALVTRDAVGRSAYLCPRRACFDQALKRRAFVRAFSAGRRRVSVVNVQDIDAEALWDATAEQLRCEIGLLARTPLDRTRENPHAHLRRRGLEQLLFELSSPPQPPGRRVALTPANHELARKGGAPDHG